MDFTEINFVDTCEYTHGASTTVVQCYSATDTMFNFVLIGLLFASVVCFTVWFVNYNMKKR